MSHCSCVATDLGDGALIRGLWVYTTVTSTGWATTPSGNSALVVSVFPRSATTLSHGTTDPLYVRRHQVATNGPYYFSDFFPGPVPRFVKVDIHNATGSAMTANVLSVTAEWVKETS